MIHFRNYDVMCKTSPKKAIVKTTLLCYFVLTIAITAAATDKVVCAINPFPCCYRTHNHQSSTPNCVNITFLLITVVISTGTREETEGAQESSSSHTHSQS